MTEFFDDFRFSSFSFRQTMFSVSYLSVDWRVLVWQINVLVVMLTSKKTPPAQKIWLLPPLPTKRQVWKHSTRDAHTYMYTPHTHAWHTGLLSWCPIAEHSSATTAAEVLQGGWYIYRRRIEKEARREEGGWNFRPHTRPTTKIALQQHACITQQQQYVPQTLQIAGFEK